MAVQTYLKEKIKSDMDDLRSNELDEVTKLFELLILDEVKTAMRLKALSTEEE